MTSHAAHHLHGFYQSVADSTSFGALFASPALPEAIARAPAAVLAALVVSAVALVTLLAQVAVYRRLAARHGI